MPIFFKERFLSLSIFLSTFLIALFLFPKTNQALATDYYVATNGSDSNPGTLSQPWKNISYGIKRFNPGDTLNIRGGAYNIGSGHDKLYSYLTITKSGSQGSPITVQAYQNEHVIIDGNWVTGRFLDITGDYWVIEGLEITNLRTRGMMIQGSHNIVRNNTIHDILLDPGLFSTTTTEGIGLKEDNGNCDYNLIENNHIYNLPEGEGIYFGTAGPQTTVVCENNLIVGNEIHDIWEGIDGKILAKNSIIKENEFYNCGKNGVISPDGNKIEANIFHQCGHSSSKSAIVIRRNSLVVNNVFYDNPEYAIRISGDTNDYFNNWVMGYGNLIYHNTIVGNGVGIKFFGTSSIKNNKIMNNVAAFNSQQIDSSGLGSGNVIDYNDWYGSGNSHPLDGSHTLHIDPRFVNRSNFNFRLLSSSPLIDAGLNVGVTNDFDGNSRPRGNGYDIGAYEYGGTPLTPSPIPTSPPSLSLFPGWNEIVWPNVAGKKASDVPPECPMAVTKENSWLNPYVKNYGGGDFEFDGGKTYYLKCNQEVVWSI